MTQTQITGPAVALTTGYAEYGTLTTTFFPLLPVETARQEFGPTLDDALDFLAGTTCNVCGISADELRECGDCGVRACNCEILADSHDEDTYFCPDCARSCFCPGCTD